MASHATAEEAERACAELGGQIERAKQVVAIYRELLARPAAENFEGSGSLHDRRSRKKRPTQM